MKISIFKPTAKKLPRCLIYKHENVTVPHTFPKTDFKSSLYKMADTKTGEYVGHMFAHPERKYVNDEIYPLVHKCDALSIDRLVINKKQRHKGYGTEFVKFAENESKNKNCNGRVFLVASAASEEKEPSHMFYRKKGFKTIYAEVNDKLDRFIVNGFNEKGFEPFYMYLPIGDKPPIPKRVKLKNFVRNIINKFSTGEN